MGYYCLGDYLVFPGLAGSGVMGSRGLVPVMDFAEETDGSRFDDWRGAFQVCILDQFLHLFLVLGCFASQSTPVRVLDLVLDQVLDTGSDRSQNGAI